MAPSKKRAGTEEDGQLEIELAAAEGEAKPKRARGRAKKEPENETTETELPLEEAFAKLDEIMEQLEQGEASLEDSFLLYQKGMQLLKQCNESIDRVEKKLIVLEEEGI